MSTSAPTRRPPGLNDGLILPESYKTASTLSRVTVAATPESAHPLRGEIKYPFSPWMQASQLTICTRLIVVLAEFTDHQFVAGAKDNLKDLFFSNGKIATGSVTEYYSEVSGGLVTLTGEVVGPFRLPHTAAYYANGDYGLGPAYPNSRTMADDALTAMGAGTDFSPFDNNRTGLVRLFFL